MTTSLSIDSRILIDLNFQAKTLTFEGMIHQAESLSGIQIHLDPGIRFEWKFYSHVRFLANREAIYFVVKIILTSRARCK